MMEAMLERQTLLVIRHRVYIYGMGQSILVAPHLHTVRRTKRQIQDDEIKVDDRGTCVDKCTYNRDIDPTTTRPVEAKTIEESSKFENCILARSQQHITKMRPKGEVMNVIMRLMSQDALE